MQARLKLGLLPLAGMLWVAACGGTVIIDGDNGAQEPLEPALREPVGPADDPAGPCLSCDQWLDACGDGEVCPAPDRACSGARPVLDDLLECMCAGCVDVCHGSCDLFDQQDEACHTCQTGILIQTCGYEYFECVGE